MSAAPSSPAPLASERLVAIDWMRGFVMLLMAVDHGSAIMNTGRVAADTAWDFSAMGVHGGDGALPAAQFLTRWVTHLCAPTFLFLSGTSLALSTDKRAREGATDREIDRHLILRGLLLLLLEAGWMSLVMSAGMGHYAAILQVLYAIGASLVLMAFLRRLPVPALVALGLGWFAVGEALTLAVAPPPAGPGGLEAPLSLLFSPAVWDFAVVMYPMTPWLAMMMLGWAFGQHLVARRRSGRGLAPAPLCALGGALSLAVFAAVRAWNGYGNMDLPRRDDSWVEWLHVSKYPPSLSYASLELGIMALCLAALFALQGRMERVSRWNPILVLGQTALFFYLIHIHLLGVGAAALGLIQHGSLRETWLGALAVVIALYPACLWYRGYKAAHPRGWPQYV